MELVYVWIEKYKNIVNQEFNFSSKFKCFKKDEKLIINTREYIQSLFPNNINITAVVGANGSGKSNLQKTD